MTDKLQIEALIALADELDAAGYEQYADDLEGAIKGVTDLPEYEGGQEEAPSPKGGVDLARMVLDFQQNPTKEGASSIEEALDMVLQERANVPSEDASKGLQEKREMSDEETASQVQQYDDKAGVPEGGWPDNPGYKLSKEEIKNLVAMADRLDDIGAKEAADKVDGFLKKYAEDNQEDFLDYQGEDDSGEQSKRYDDKHHKDMLVRTPKNDKARVDLEGRGEHHVSTQKEASNGLNTRYCPDHVGVSVGRVGENVYQCPLDGKVYNWETGWEDYDGNKHPGGSVAAQTPDAAGYAVPHKIFDTRENVINSVN